MMLQVEEYRKKAANCRRMAENERDEKAKTSLLEMSQTYEMLAQRRLHFLEIQEEIRAKKD